MTVISDLGNEDGTQRRSAVESRSIDYVPDSERHGKVWQQTLLWAQGNINLYMVAIGMIGPAAGLTFWWSVLAAGLGAVFGTLFVALHATQGPALGLPQMVQSRAQLGHRGVLIALVATLFTFVGFNVSNLLVLGSGLRGLFGLNPLVLVTVIVVVSATLAIYGHDWLHRAFRVLFYLCIPFWVLLTAGMLLGLGPTGPAATTPDQHGFTAIGFVLQFTAAAGYSLAYAPYISDYSRYLPRTTNPRHLIAAVFFGAVLSSIWLMTIGAWMAIHLGQSDTLTGVQDIGNAIFTGFGTTLISISVLATIGTSALNTYCASLTVLTGWDSIRPISASRGKRAGVTVAISLVALMLSIWLMDSGSLVTTIIGDLLVVMLYLLAPWTAINLTDYFLIRRGRYSVVQLFRRDGMYGTWAWRGIIAFLVGIAAEIPFMTLSYYKGVAADWLSGVDLALIPGLFVSSILYYLLSRSQDLSIEQPIIDRDNAELPR